MNWKNRQQFRTVVAYPYGASPYGGAAMYSAFNHGRYPMPDADMNDAPVAPMPQVLKPPQK